MTRRQLRENVFALLFRADFYAPEDMNEQTSLFREELEQANTAFEEHTAEPADEVGPVLSAGRVNEADKAYITKKAQAVMEMIPQIDAAIDAVADRWKTGRMGKVELTLLRLAYYEMKYDDDVPQSVAIDEAVELAKRYGQDGAGAFVNAILAKLV